MEKSKSKTISRIMLVAMAALIFALSGLSAFGPLCTLKSSLVSNIVSFILIPVAFVLGCFLIKSKTIALDEILLIVGGCFAVISIINLVATINEFGVMHLLLLKETPIYYYNGFHFDATKETISLINFSFVKTPVEQSGIYPLIAGVYFGGAFLFNFKKDKVKFIVSLLIGLSGIASLILIGNIKPFAILVLVIFIISIYNKILKNSVAIGRISVLKWCLFALAILYLSIIIINIIFDSQFTGFLEKVFETNHVVNNANKVLSATFIKDGGKFVNLFGLTDSYVYGYDIENTLATNANIVEVEIVKEAGVLGMILLLIISWLTMYKLQRIETNKNIGAFEHFILPALLGAYFVYSSLYYVSTPIIDGGYSPLLRSTTFIVVVFVIGLLFSVDEEEKE